MVNRNLQEFFNEKKLQNIPKKIKDEIEILYKLGIEFYELEYLVYTKIKEEIILKKS